VGPFFGRPHPVRPGNDSPHQPATLSALLQEILGKYSNWLTGQALPVISRQQTGNLIKEMLREAGIDAPYVRGRYKGAINLEPILPKWQATATHPARHA